MKYHLLTYGCQMNKNDSERIAGLLLDIGYEESPKYEDADLIILNTCSVRQSAEDRVYGMMKNFVKLKEKNPDLIIVVTGCMAGRDKDGKIQKRLPDVDIFLPTEDLVRLPDILAQRLSPPRKGEAVESSRERGDSPAFAGSPGEKIYSHSAVSSWSNDNPPLRKEGGGSSPFQKGRAGEGFYNLVPKYSSPSQAFITIQTGCEEYCTYCVVPYARGKIKNRPLAEILREIKSAVSGGAVEITLLGQIVNAWHVRDGDCFTSDNPSANSCELADDNADDFAAMLWEINQISGIKRLNFVSAHPRYMTDGVIEAMRLPAHLNYLHLPVQSGSDKILQKMNRRYTAEEYLEIIKKIRDAKPQIALATDIIVGFPGETEKDFEDTIELYKKCDFDIAYLAKYSPRSGTPAFKALKDDVPHDEKERRWRVLQNLMEETALRKNQKYLGREVEVLVESCRDGKCAGNSREMKRVVFPGGESLIGQIVKVKISEAKEWELEGDAAH